MNFTLAYAAPEVAAAFHAGERYIESSAALDSWSLGVMAFELLTGAPAFNLLTEGRAGVRLRPPLPNPAVTYRLCLNSQCPAEPCTSCRRKSARGLVPAE